MKLHIATILIAALATACGAAQEKANKDSDNKDEGEASNQDDGLGGSEDSANLDTSAIVGDVQIAGDVVTAQIDEGISALAEDVDAAEGGFALYGLDAEAESKRFRECKEEGGQAIVDVLHSVTRSWSFEGPVRSGSMQASSLRERHRTWSRQDGEMTCDASGKFVLFDPQDMEGVSLDMTLKGEMSRVTSFSNKASGKTTERSIKVSREGERHIKWTNVGTEGDHAIIAKEIAFDVTRSLQLKNKNGEEKSLAGSIRTAEESPLLTEIVRNAATGAYVQRLIKSGKLVATNEDGGLVVTTFDNVLFKAADGCLAVSGKTSGEIFAKDAAEPSVTFEVNHGQNAVVMFSTGETYEYVADGCEFDLDAVGIKELDSAEGIK